VAPFPLRDGVQEKSSVSAPPQGECVMDAVSRFDVALNNISSSHSSSKVLPASTSPFVSHARARARQTRSTNALSIKRPTARSPRCSVSRRRVRASGVCPHYRAHAESHSDDFHVLRSFRARSRVPSRVNERFSSRARWSDCARTRTKKRRARGRGRRIERGKR